MSDINPIGRAHVPQVPTANNRGAAEKINGHARPTQHDAVELSDRARLLSKLHELPDIRQGLVDRIKTEIELGTYESDEKIDAALEGLLESGDL